MSTPLYHIIKRKWAEEEVCRDPDLCAYKASPCACCGAPVSAPGWQLRTPRGHWLTLCLACSSHIALADDGRVLATSDVCRLRPDGSPIAAPPPPPLAASA